MTQQQDGSYNLQNWGKEDYMGAEWSGQWNCQTYAERLIKAWGLSYPSEHVTPITDNQLAKELLDLYMHFYEERKKFKTKDWFYDS